MLYFEWDERKALENLEKHGVNFNTAKDVFADEFAIEEDDQVVDGEVRLRIIGMVQGFAVLIVSHTNREGEGSGDEITRIISARKATKSERKRYDELRAQDGWDTFD